MTMKQVFTAMALFAALAVGTLQTTAPAFAADVKTNKLVIQVSDNDPAKWNLALNNALNVQKDLGKDKVQIEIIAYGPGLNMLKAESKVRDRVVGAMDGGVGIVACDNTIRNMKLTNADLIGGIAHVDSGVVGIMKRQQEGWAYVRP
ncbi:MAG TPA: hypothetical protein VIS77_12510 [Burkholderiales bacterium]